MACTRETIKSSGLNVWSSNSAFGPALEVDIIAVQGLGAHPFYTWVKKVQALEKPQSRSRRSRFWFGKGSKTHDDDQNDGSTEVMWPRDLLIPLFKNARIATYSYESDWKDPAVKTSLRQCADQFLNVLLQHRQQESERQRPLVLIGHSLGGLVIQQALVIAALTPDFDDIRLSVAGIIFLGAPFQGSDAAMIGKWVAQLARLDSTLLGSLKRDSPSLHALSRDFWNSHSEWDMVCFYENKDASYGPLKPRIVSAQSASFHGKRVVSLNTDHSGLNKFSGKNDENFALLLPEIQRMVERGSSVLIDRHKRKGTDQNLKSVTSTLEHIESAPAGHAKPTGNVHWMVPRTVNSLFTGRAELLDRIRNAVNGNVNYKAREQKRFIISGLGGQGKSEVCLKAANLMREDFWGVFWVDVGIPAIAKSEFIAVAKTLGAEAESISDACRVLAATKQSWLLILDNADDPLFDYQVYLPSGNHGTIIMTSRNPECSQYSTVGSEELSGLGMDHSIQLLLKATGIPAERWLDYDQQARDVVGLLGLHTLALIQAGTYVSKGHSRLDQYPDVYHRQRKRLLRYRPVQAQSRYCDVYTTFEASAQVLESSKDEIAIDALYLLGILSVLHSSIFPFEIFEDAWINSRKILRSGNKRKMIGNLLQWHVSQLPGFMVVDAVEWDPHRLFEASSFLVSLSLVTRHSSATLSGLSMHPLAHSWAKDRLEPDQQNQAWITAGCILALSHNPNALHRRDRHLRPHLQALLDIKIKIALSLGSQAKLIPILLWCGCFLIGVRDDSRLSRLLDDIFTELGINPVTPAKKHLKIYELSARSLMNLGQYSSAVKLLENIVKIEEKLLASNHPDQLISQHNLARAYEANGQVAEAIDLLEHVVKIQEKLLASGHPDRLASQYVLAIAYKANGQVAEAIDLLEHIIKIQEKLLPSDHPDQLSSQHVLAVAYKANGQVAEAIDLLEHIIKIQEKLLPSDHPDQLSSQHALAVAYEANGQVAEAINLLERVVKIREKSLASDHPNRLASQHVLAVAYEANGQVEEAIDLFEHVVKIKRSKLAEGHRSRNASEQWLARCLQKQAT